MRCPVLSLWAMGLLLTVLTGCKGGDSASPKPGGSGSSSSGQKNKTSGSDQSSAGADSTGKSGGKSEGGSGDAAGSGSDASAPTDTVKIDPNDQAKAGIRIVPVQVRTVPRTLSVAGQVAMDEKQTEHLGAYADGQIERVLVSVGDTVRAGQTLSLMHSHTVHETQGSLMQAFAAVTRQESGVRFAQENRDRYQHLLQLQVASQEEAQRAEQQLRQAQQDLADAQANVHMEREHLSDLLQINPEVLTPQTVYKYELIPVRAVKGGTVVQREVTPGQVVNLGDEQFVVSNLSAVWVTASVNEKDLPFVHVGARVHVTTQGYGDTSFPGKVQVLGAQLDPQTRTVPVRVQVPNPGTKLRPGMFTTANIDEPATRNSIYVPDAALQDVNGFRVVFATQDGTSFQVRAVKLGAHSEGLVEVIEGLKPGDHIVVDGAFMVKGELLKGSVGEG